MTERPVRHQRTRTAGSPGPEAPERDRRRLLNWGELLATCAASALATVLLSRLGVAGTILGAALTPLIITLTTTALSSEAERAREAAGQLARKNDRGPSLDPERRRRLRAALATAAAATGILVAGIAFSEAIDADPVGGGRDDGSRSRSGEQAPVHESPTPTDGGGGAVRPSPTSTASVGTPTPTPTPTPTSRPAPTVTATAPSASPTAAP